MVSITETFHIKAQTQSPRYCYWPFVSLMYHVHNLVCTNPRASHFQGEQTGAKQGNKRYDWFPINSSYPIAPPKLPAKGALSLCLHGGVSRSDSNEPPGTTQPHSAHTQELATACANPIGHGCNPPSIAIAGNSLTPLIPSTSQPTWRLASSLGLERKALLNNLSNPHSNQEQYTGYTHINMQFVASHPWWSRW